MLFSCFNYYFLVERTLVHFCYRCDLCVDLPKACERINLWKMYEEGGRGGEIQLESWPLGCKAVNIEMPTRAQVSKVFQTNVLWWCRVKGINMCKCSSKQTRHVCLYCCLNWCTTVCRLFHGRDRIPIKCTVNNVRLTQRKHANSSGRLSTASTEVPPQSVNFSIPTKVDGSEQRQQSATRLFPKLHHFIIFFPMLNLLTRARTFAIDNDPLI